MTAIAGLFGASPFANDERACRASLDALRLYGSRTSVQVTPKATFGLNLWETLPEERFDAQPYCDSRFLLVADVRLDNREEILTALAGSSTRNRGISDAEILFHAWIRWQERCLEKIVGDYAFAVHDSQSGKLFLVRDPIGQRPLFYARAGGAWLFASMPSGLFPHVGLEHDRIRVAQRLAATESESRRSYFERVTRVLSGETVVLGDGAITTSRWAPKMREAVGDPDLELADELRATLDLAVGARMRRIAAPIATHLSSGWDSSAVTATAAMLGKGSRLIAFTSAPATTLEPELVPGRNIDESKIAAETARALNIQHEIVRPDEPLLSTLRHHTRYFQEPVRNVLNMGWWGEIDQRARERGATVLLTGEVGNLSLSVGGLNALADWVRKCAWLRWAEEAIAVSRRPDVHWRGILMSSFRFYVPQRAMEQLIRLAHGQPRWRSACFLRPEALDSLPDINPQRPRTQAMERLSILRGFDAGVFRKGALAKYGVDERDPTADRRLIEFALRLSPRHLLHRGTYKPLARAALEGRLTPAVLDAPFRGYQGADWISRISRDAALAVLEEISGDATVQEVIDLPRLRNAISVLPTNLRGRSGTVESFGRHLTNALAMGVFLIESREPDAMGV